MIDHKDEGLTLGHTGALVFHLMSSCSDCSPPVSMRGQPWDKASVPGSQGKGETLVQEGHVLAVALTNVQSPYF